jgi:hypothetical protein
MVAAINDRQITGIIGPWCICPIGQLAALIISAFARLFNCRLILKQ